MTLGFLVNGKTGPRKVRAVWSIDYLNDWLKVHPGKNNPEAPLWFNFAKKTEKLEAMQYGAIRMQLNRYPRKRRNLKENSSSFP
jgi:integrase/recombinase XerD